MIVYTKLVVGTEYIILLSVTQMLDEYEDCRSFGHCVKSWSYSSLSLE